MPCAARAASVTSAPPLTIRILSGPRQLPNSSSDLILKDPVAMVEPARGLCPFARAANSCPAGDAGADDEELAHRDVARSPAYSPHMLCRLGPC
jgi:hypothetical protein